MGKEQLPPWKVWSLSALSMQGQHSVTYQIARECYVFSRVHVCFIGCYTYIFSRRIILGNASSSHYRVQTVVVFQFPENR